MDSQLLSELTILFLLLLASARIYFKHSERKEPLSIVPFIALVSSLLSLVAWGLRVQELLLVALSGWVFIWNFRALLRLNQSLIIDHHSTLFILISSINCILTIIAIAFVVYFRPVHSNLAKEGIEKQTTRLVGNLTDGFTDESDPKEWKTLDLIRYQAQETAGQDSSKGTIVFLPAECASVSLYEPFLGKLAHDGYTVYSADFFCDGVQLDTTMPFIRETKRFSFVHARLTGSAEYKDWCETKKEPLYFSMFEAMEKLIPANQADETLIIVGDGLPKNLYTSLLWKNTRFARCFDIANIQDYTTPGWGPVEQTDPLLATILGFSRDGARYTANRTASVLEQTIGSAEAKAQQQDQQPDFPQQ